MDHLKVLAAAFAYAEGWGGLHPYTRQHLSSALALVEASAEDSEPYQIAADILREGRGADLTAVAFLGAVLGMPIVHLHPGMASAVDEEKDLVVEQVKFLR